MDSSMGCSLLGVSVGFTEGHIGYAKPKDAPAPQRNVFLVG